jgi:hypothetical protein
MLHQVRGQGKASGKHMPYSQEHFGILVGDLLTTKDVRLTTTKLRHMFITGWLDYNTNLSTQVHKLVGEGLCKDASSMMLNSMQVWSAYYDDATFDRSFLSTMSHWGKFQEFMKDKHLDKKSEKPIDPSTFGFFSLLSSCM